MIAAKDSILAAAKRRKALTLPALVSLPQEEAVFDGMGDDGAGADSYAPTVGRGLGSSRSPTKDGDAFDAQVNNWLESCPGSFRSRDPRDPYRRAFEAFRAAVDFDPIFRLPDFILSLSRLGYEGGTITFRGREIFLLVLPASIDSALDSLALVERSGSTEQRFSDTLEDRDFKSMQPSEVEPRRLPPPRA